MIPIAKFLGDWKKVFKISFGLFYVFLNLWIIFHVPVFVDPSEVLRWQIILLSYLGLNVAIMANADIRNRLFDVKLTDFLLRMALFFIPAFLIFLFILARVLPFNEPFFLLVSKVPFHLALFHLFTFSVSESIVFQGYLNDIIGTVAGTAIFGLFHVGIWSGPWILVLIGAGLLGLLFSWVRFKFSKSTSDYAPVVGVHFAWNMAKLASIYGGLS